MSLPNEPTSNARFERLRQTSADGAAITFCRHGGQLLSFVPAGGEEALFVAERAKFASGAAIRGGIPVIFPQFGSFGRLPKHGFARTASFDLLEQGRDEGGAAIAELGLRATDETRALFPFDFGLRIRIRAEGETLRLELHVENQGAQAFEFTTALHTYLTAHALSSLRVEGLGVVPFREYAKHPPQEAGLRFGQEVDRVYAGAPDLRVIDGKRTLSLKAEGFSEWVVWNPGPELGAALQDLGSEGAERFVCIEAAIVNSPILLGAGATFKAAFELRVS